jgi:hypothetical protein
MKINFKNIFYYLTLAIVLISCNQEEEVNYTTKVSALPPTITVITSNVTDNSFDVDYTAESNGILYYAIQLSKATPPDASNIIGQSSGSLVNAMADLTSSNTLSYSMVADIYGAYDYSIYSVMTSVDGIASSVIKTDVTTPDTADPVFLGDASSPSFQAAGISPFAPVTFTFSEPVFYQGGDITFTGYASGRTIIVNDDSALSMSGASLTVDTHGTFEQDSFIIVTWADGTFKDNSGKSVAGLSGFGHYFKTRLFTAPEAAALMVGTYNYETVFYGGFLEDFYTANAALFLPSSGEFKLELDPSDPTGTTLLGVNVYSSLANYGYFANENLKLKFGAAGALEILEAKQGANGLGGFAGTTADVIWGPYIADAVTALPGFYNVTSGNITQYLSLMVKDTGAIIDEMDYNYTRIGTYAKPSFEELEKKNEFLKKKRAQYNTYKKVEYQNLKILN